MNQYNSYADDLTNHTSNVYQDLKNSLIEIDNILKNQKYILTNYNNNKQSIGFIFGSFDPIHIGHIQLIVDTLKYFDNIIIVPAKQNVFKAKSTPFFDRVVMINDTIKDMRLSSYVASSIIESNFEQDSVYTDQVLKQIQKTYSQNYNIYWILTEETYLEIPKWHNFEYLEKFPKYLYSKNQYEDSSIKGFISPVKNIDIHSTDIRNMIKNGIDPRPFITGGTYVYIKNNNLYK